MLKYRKICYKRIKYLRKKFEYLDNNIILYLDESLEKIKLYNKMKRIRNNCNLKIKNKKELIVLFHNSKGYDNSYMIDIFSKIENIRINCLAENNQKFQMLNFKIPEKKYNIKIIDSLSFLQGNLDSLSKDLYDDLKIITKEHFKNNFEMINKKLENFPYNYINPDNLNEKDLPEKKRIL